MENLPWLTKCDIIMAYISAIGLLILLVERIIINTKRK